MRIVNLVMNIVFVALLCSPIPASALTLEVIVGTNDIVDGAVTTPKIADSAVTTAKVADGAITAAKLAPGAVTPAGYAGMKVVHKGAADGVYTFNSITAALDSITNASAANPYLVKVMPGVYDLGTESVQMKEYVDMEGSGPDNTIITSSNYNIDTSTCTVGTVLMANNSSIRHIKIVNNAPLQDIGSSAVAALVFDNIKAKAEGVNVLVKSDAVDSKRSIGICSYGEFAHATLNNVSVESHNQGAQSNAIKAFYGSSFTVTNSKLVSYKTDLRGKTNVINSASGDTIGTITISNSTIEGIGLSVNVLFIQGYNTKITNSTIMGATEEPYVNETSTLKIANSLLPGSFAGLTGAKLVNNYDENFDPIPNQ